MSDEKRDTDPTSDPHGDEDAATGSPADAAEGNAADAGGDTGGDAGDPAAESSGDAAAQTGTADGGGGASAGAPVSGASGEDGEKGFFAEIVADLLALDFRTILACLFVVLGLLFAVFGATGSTLVNFVFLCLPVFTSWLFHNGWITWTEGDRPKILFLTLVAGILCLAGMIHMASFAAADTIRP